MVFSKGEHVLDHTRVAKTQLSLLRSFLPPPRFSNHKRLRKKIPLALSGPNDGGPHERCSSSRRSDRLLLLKSGEEDLDCISPHFNLVTPRSGLELDLPQST
jgi:hypothetical protein